MNKKSKSEKKILREKKKKGKKTHMFLFACIYFQKRVKRNSSEKIFHYLLSLYRSSHTYWNKFFKNEMVKH